MSNCQDCENYKPKPAPDCRRWGQCTSLAKAERQPCCGCASYEPDDMPAPEPAPEPSVEERLREAGASVDSTLTANHLKGNHACIYSDGTVNLGLNRLTPDHAVAALRAATGDKEYCVGCYPGLVQDLMTQRDTLKQQLAAAQAEAERLKGERELMRAACIERDTQIHNMLENEKIAASWLARNKEA